MIVGNIIGGVPSSPKTIKILTSTGQEIQAVLVDSEKLFTAEANDVREGKTFASDYGVGVGNRVIPAYHTTQGFVMVANEKPLIINGLQDNYDYTKLQAIVCLLNTNLNDSVAAEQISVGDKLYNVKSTEALSEISKNNNNKTIELGATNTFGRPCIIRFFMCREVL